MSLPENPNVKALQEELNLSHGAHLTLDGLPGPATARAFLIARRAPPNGWETGGLFREAETLLWRFTKPILDDMDGHLARCDYRRLATECTCGLATRNTDTHEW